MTEYITAGHVVKALANLPQLVFEVTDACNLRCKYCAFGEFYDDYDYRENKNLPVEYATRLIDYLVPYWNSSRNVSALTPLRISFYGGEPLLNFGFIEQIVDYVEHRIDCPHHRFSYSMTTNAILLHKYMDFLKEHEFSLLISLDGNERNDAYRVDKAGRSSFARVVANVDKLREKYPDYFERYVNFNAVLHNKNSVEEIYRFFKDKYGKIPRIGELNNVGIRVDKVREFNRTYRSTRESLRQAEHYEEIEQEMFMESANYKTLALFLFQYSGNVYDDYLELLYDKEQLKRIPTGTCLPFTKKMFVTVNGKILPCERIGHQFALGNITKDSIELHPQAIADIYNGYYAKMESRCQTCKNSRACIQCLFNLQGIEKRTPVCYGYMNETDFKRFAAQQMNFLRKHPDAYRKIMEKVIRL